jgi:acyl carrier protein
MTDAEIFAHLAAVMQQTFPGRLDPDEVGPTTRFFGDLGLASIDAVVLAEAIERSVGRKLPFARFLAELRDRGATDLELGELVAFLRDHL